MHRLWVLGLAGLLVLLAGCGREAPQGEPAETTAPAVGERLKVVATTSQIADLAREIGGERVEVTGLMGPGVDPHLYKASEGDIRAMANADVILYSGLHLEGKMGDILAQMPQRGTPAVALAEKLPETLLLSSVDYPDAHDPHVWFSVPLWEQIAGFAADALAEADPEGAETYRANAQEYQAVLDHLHEQVMQKAQTIPAEQRVLVTAHDAFRYFGDTYGFEVRGLQGISTATEAGTGDVQQLAEFLAQRRIPAVFVETSVPDRNLQAVMAAVAERGFDVELGGQLYSDAMGDPDTPKGTYVGMINHNIDTIRAALRGDAPAAGAGDGER